jgi:hypothetical protein
MGLAERGESRFNLEVQRGTVKIKGGPYECNGAEEVYVEG